MFPVDGNSAHEIEQVVSLVPSMHVSLTDLGPTATRLEKWFVVENFIDLFKIREEQRWD